MWSMKIPSNSALFVLLVYPCQVLSDYFDAYSVSAEYGSIGYEKATFYNLSLEERLGEYYPFNFGIKKVDYELERSNDYGYFASLNYELPMLGTKIRFGPRVEYVSSNEYYGLGIKVLKDISESISIFSEAQVSNSDLKKGFASQAYYSIGFGVSWSFWHPERTSTKFSEDTIKANDMFDKGNTEKSMAEEVLKKVNPDRSEECDKESIKLINVFRKNSSYIDNFENLDQTVKCLNNDSKLFLNITNFNSFEGNEKYNIWLADRRIERMKSFYKSRGISSDRIEFVNIWQEGLNTQYRKLIIQYGMESGDYE